MEERGAPIFRAMATAGTARLNIFFRRRKALTSSRGKVGDDELTTSFAPEDRNVRLR